MKFHQQLSSSWMCRSADAADSARAWIPAVVPGCIHTDLRRAGEIPDPFWGKNERTLEWVDQKYYTYRCEFTANALLFDQARIDLVAEGLDTFATLSLNGKKIGRTENMFLGYRFDLRRHLKRDKNVLEITFRSTTDVIKEQMKPGHFREPCDPVSGASIVRKEQCSFGWDWAPRLIGAGIWQPIYLEGWSHARFESVRVLQQHTRSRVILNFAPTLSTRAEGSFRGTISLGGKIVARIEHLRAVVPEPRLWWPNGHGDQPLYEVELELLAKSGEVVDVWRRRIGLRTIKLDRRPDKFGEKFQFVVNGRAIFAKGANWIPAHSFVTEVNGATYDDLLTSAAEAHMNMVRVWGGGIYEQECFYDLCDEKGLLVWQDFMFACALYPGNQAFLNSVSQEAAFQVRRLAHRACLALWCGNNELEQFSHEILKTPERKKAYVDLFYTVLPEAVAAWDGVTPYWPSSPHNPEGWEKGHNNERAGDCHFWDVWHARKPVKTYEQKKFRFCSEFGMQSYSSPEVAATYCECKDWNVFGPEMENHQKNGAGNQIILDYIARLYRFPKDYAALSFLSQLNQAYCMKVGVEHFRRSMPRTMGALYWQLNDCWPCASWSSLEFGGRWKALHYEARRFFAPALLSAHVPGDETHYIASNRLESTIREVHLYTVFDGIEDCEATLKWDLCHLEKGCLRRGSQQVQLKYGESVRQLSLDFAVEMKSFGAPSLYLRAELCIGSSVASRQTVFLTAPRYLTLKKAPITWRVSKKSPRHFELEMSSAVFQAQVAFILPAISHRADDNFINLYPDEPRHIEIQTQEDFTAADLHRQLHIQSLALTC